MNILCITDQAPESEHSAVEGIFNNAIQRLAKITIVYFSRKANKPIVEKQKIIFPHKYKRADIFKVLKSIIDFQAVDVVIVRNFFPILKTILAHKKNYTFYIGFWESFPHSFRRLFQAKVENRSILRKSLEYKIKRITEMKLLSQCDFYLPITETYKQQFYPNLNIPYCSLPVGVDFSKVPENSIQRKDIDGDTKKYIYAGTIDPLRQFDVVISAFTEYDGNFSFDLYTQSQNLQVEKIKSINDKRITVHMPVSRSELFKRMVEYDVGIGLIPDNKLYHVSSPTKTLEYYALGIPAIINRLPEYTALFSNSSAFYCSFSKESIKACIDKISHLSRIEIRKKGILGRDIVQSKRDYTELSHTLFNFILQQDRGRKQ